MTQCDEIGALYDRLDGATTGLVPSRARFRSFYDGWLAERRLAGGPQNFIHAVVRGMDACGDTPRPEKSVDAMCLALAALGDPLEIVTCFNAALSASLFDGTDPKTIRDAPKRVEAAMTGAKGAPDEGFVHAILHRSTREVMTSPTEMWTDPGHLLPAILLARRRLCKVVILDDQDMETAQGSGFLIGPGAVLTNLHVVQEMVEHPGGHTLEVEFDFSETVGMRSDEATVFRPPEDWLLAKGALGREEPDDPQPYWWDDRETRRGWLAEVKDQLDFAVIRLEGAPGLQRGWYDLPEKWARPGAVWALHHPAWNPHTITRGTEPIGVRGRPPHRFFHDASTIGGSSGGLMLDGEGEAVGLHYMGLDADRAPANAKEKNRTINVAITLAAIAEQLEDQGKLEEIAEAGMLRPFRGCLDGRHPVFGRKAFLDDLKVLFNGGKQIMRIDVEPPAHGEPPLKRPGKSFSGDILRATFRGPEHHHVRFSASDVEVDAYRIAADTLATFAEDLVDTLPKAPDTTSPAYILRLVGALARAIRERLPDRTVWVVLDDLDRYDLSNASGREFLATLYDQIRQIPNLRVVLIGLPGGLSISGLAEDTVIHSQIDAADIGGLEDRFIEWLRERGERDTPIDEKGARFIASILASFARTDAPLERLAQFTSDHVGEAADALFGSATTDGAGGE